MTRSLSRPASGSLPWGWIAVIWLGLVALTLIANPEGIAIWRFPDPDDQLRLVQVRDLLAGQAWFDLHQYRIDQGNSAVMHWSRLVDIPLVLAIVLLAPIAGQELAEHIAVVLIPLLTLAGILAVIGRMAFRLFGREIAILSCLACGFSPLLLVQLQPMRIDHHGWQVFTVILALGALLHRRPAIGGSIAGLAIAAGLLISLEVLPLAAAFAGVLLLRWLRDQARGWLTGYLVGLAAGLVGLFGLTRGFGDLTQYCDAVSPAHLTFFAIVGLGAAAIAAAPRRSALTVVGLFGIVGAVAAAAFVWQAPQCLAGPFGNLDPLVHRYWYLKVLEGQPFWAQPLDQSIPPLVQAVAALGATFQLWRTSGGERRAWWLDYGLLLGAAVVAGLLVWRSMAFAGAMSALPLGWLASRLMARFRAADSPVKRWGVVLTAVAVLFPASPVSAAKKVMPAFDGTEANTPSESTCDLTENMYLLNRVAPATVFAPLDIGPTVLERTRHSVVATGHHRAEHAMHDVIAAFTSPEPAAQAIVRRHGARYLLICSDLAEAKIYAASAPRGLMAQLRAGKAPAWLEEIPLGAPQTFKLWRVRN